ncbi:MAG: ABC transporter permease [Oscillospiraceae bacterium]|nr:ABC transporter permease [Oscillospiraceae bacterium]
MLRRFSHQAWLNFKGANAAFSFEEFTLLRLLYPLVTLTFYVLLAAYSFNAENLTHWVVGNSFLLCVNVSLFTLGQGFDSERIDGRLRSIIVAPENKLVAVLQKAAFPMLVSVITVFAGFIVSSLIFSVPFYEINLWLFMVVVIVSMFAASGLGLLLAALSLMTDSMHLILNTMNYVLMIFCGANFPIAQMPAWAGVLSQALPLTRGIEAANMLFTQNNPAAFAGLIFGEFVIGAIFFLLAFLAIKYAERTAIRRASLELF